MELNFENRRILVTGAGSGIGRELCKTLATEGKATVIALSKTKGNLDSLVAECPAIQTICVDLSNWNETKAAVESVLPVHALVNNAGKLNVSPFLDIDPADIDDIYGVNVKAVINVSQVVARGMKESGQGGTIVNVSSVTSLGAVGGFGIYCSSKSALDMVSKVMALELAPFNIRVNCVNPTVVLTDMGKKAWADPEKAKARKSKIPMGKFVEVKDVIHPILFLLSEKSEMITGITLPVDGGLTAT